MKIFEVGEPISEVKCHVPSNLVGKLHFFARDVGNPLAGALFGDIHDFYRAKSIRYASYPNSDAATWVPLRKLCPSACAASRIACSRPIALCSG